MAMQCMRSKGVGTVWHAALEAALPTQGGLGRGSEAAAPLATHLVTEPSEPLVPVTSPTWARYRLTCRRHSAVSPGTTFLVTALRSGQGVAYLVDTQHPC
jgi:hypothetical protein